MPYEELPEAQQQKDIIFIVTVKSYYVDNIGNFKDDPATPDDPQDPVDPVDPDPSNTVEKEEVKPADDTNVASKTEKPETEKEDENELNGKS